MRDRQFDEALMSHSPSFKRQRHLHDACPNALAEFVETRRHDSIGKRTIYNQPRRLRSHFNLGFDQVVFTLVIKSVDQRLVSLHKLLAALFPR